MTETRIVIVPDDEHNARPGDFVAMGDEEDREYVAQFERGELAAFGVLLQRKCPNCGAYETVADLWGCDSYEMGSAGTYESADEIASEYLRSVARDLYAEALT